MVNELRKKLPPNPHQDNASQEGKGDRQAKGNAEDEELEYGTSVFVYDGDEGLRGMFYDLACILGR